MDANRFLVDCMLIRLGRWMRLCGKDVANPCSVDDSALLHQALAEGRVMLTRDRALAERCLGSGQDCLLIRSDQLDEQLQELKSAGVRLQLNPQRCTLCNDLLEEERRAESPGQSWRCRGCGRRYWTGSHWNGIKRRLSYMGDGGPSPREGRG
ncbi:MAG: hypothetical protein A4E45_00720 [Methanosaeta sp. PtaB.Bin039]|nr:MAG: hypothetical protein A4E45_00720 [Methanosaeta sp. PtaB.Bin039]OPY46174.1 MAG: hypothetical protein A4E47_00695 [Methanosaeta sp. PtaU1.Bin028]